MSLVIEKLQQNIDFLNTQTVEQNEKIQAKRISDIYPDSEIFCVDDVHYYLILNQYSNCINSEIHFQQCWEYPHVGKRSHQRHFSEHILLYYTQKLKFTPVTPFLDVTKNGLLNFYVNYKNQGSYYLNKYDPNISTIHQAFVKYIVTHPDWIKYVENIEHTTDSLKISFPFKKKYSFFMHAEQSYIQQTKWCVNVGGYTISEGLWNVINQKLFRLGTKIYAEIGFNEHRDHKDGQMCFPSILIENYRLIESLKDEMIVGEKQFLLDTFKFLCAFFDVCNEFYCRGKILLPPRNGYAQFKHHPTDPDYLNKFNMFKYISGSTVKPQDKVHFCKLLGFYQSSECEI